ncbi:FkbM family methyltransferase [Streptomyces sp. NPDC029526]|uniref:FkbM family methyltransferase n=1 Tax=Streptomyces sp. NPDC029526 TaxID=3155728 RepID=UPI0033F4D080
MANVMRALPALITDLGWVPQHLVHVGAHEGQEMPFYRQAGVPRITLIEPIPWLAESLQHEHPDAVVHQCACGGAPGREQLHIMARTNLSTLVPPQRVDRVTKTITVDVRRLDDLAPDADAAVIDAQGREIDVLAGAPWDSLRMVVVETCTVDDPTMAAPHDEVVAVMAGLGFTAVACWVRDYDWVSKWGRGPGLPQRGGEVRDVVFYREPS